MASNFASDVQKKILGSMESNTNVHAVMEVRIRMITSSPSSVTHEVRVVLVNLLSFLLRFLDQELLDASPRLPPIVIRTRRVDSKRHVQNIEYLLDLLLE